MPLLFALVFNAANAKAACRCEICFTNSSQNLYQHPQHRQCLCVCTPVIAMAAGLSQIAVIRTSLARSRQFQKAAEEASCIPISTRNFSLQFCYSRHAIVRRAYSSCIYPIPQCTNRRTLPIKQNKITGNNKFSVVGRVWVIRIRTCESVPSRAGFKLVAVGRAPPTGTGRRSTLPFLRLYRRLHMAARHPSSYPTKFWK